jgi:hypothetical protein
VYRLPARLKQVRCRNCLYKSCSLTDYRYGDAEGRVDGAGEERNGIGERSGTRKCKPAKLAHRMRNLLTDLTCQLQKIVRLLSLCARPA